MSDHMPQTGDVVVRNCGPDATPRYAMCAVPGPDQCGCPTRAEAERIARGFAQRSSVSLWFAESPRAFILLACFRPLARTSPHDTRCAEVQGRQSAATS
jgi:hypothetical protein